MPHFRCLICGEGFRGILEGEEAAMGFYVTRWVEAENTEAACRLVLEREWFEIAARGWADKGGRLFVDEIQIVDGTEAGANDQGLVLFRETQTEGTEQDDKASKTFLMITQSGFSVQDQLPTEPWTMTPTAITTLRGALCYETSGRAQRMIDIVPLQALRRRDHWRPWRRVPVRVVFQPVPDLKLQDIRDLLITILRGDNAMADHLLVSVEAAVEELTLARTPRDLIEAAARVTKPS